MKSETTITFHGAAPEKASTMAPVKVPAKAPTMTSTPSSAKTPVTDLPAALKARIHQLEAGDRAILPRRLQGGVGTVIVDPPWDVQQKGNYGAIKHYNLMTLKQIRELPVGELCAENAHCWLWVTNATLRAGFDILEGWGFTPRSVYTYVKPKLGLGAYLRNATEHCLLGTRGKAPVKFRAQMNWGFYPVLDHSHKPEEFLNIVRRVSPEPVLELFARRRDPLVDAVWGNEIDSDVILPGYPAPTYSQELLDELNSSGNSPKVNVSEKQGEEV